jgi:diguanylate cyclase (GGDEF)-like protein
LSSKTRLSKIFLKIFHLIKGLFVIPVSDRYKSEFKLIANKINVSRVKATAITFIVLEAILIILWLINNKYEFPDSCYGGMYVLLFTAMVIYLLLFIKLGKNIPRYGSIIHTLGIIFAGFILIWCVGISLLDQLFYGQIIVYITALLGIAVIPLFKPLTLLLIYGCGQALFLAFLPYFQQSSEVFYGHAVNSTTFLIVSWVISRMRYVIFVEDFECKNIIKEKNDELERVNKELEESNRILEKLSQTDSVTGIFNRFVFERVMLTEWDRCRRHSIPLSLIMIDIDFFKSFNDNHGHKAGDECIRCVAKLLRASAQRSSDIVARYGGDEFAVILPHMKKEDALDFAEQLRRRVLDMAFPHEYSSAAPYLTISLGVATIIPSEQSSIEELINAADQALYEAKKEHNKVVAL